ncbi:MAG TPA: hypothetical protein VMQ61_05225 [Thermoanaerobaculia bacterium]|nr:hypothetical protein [Thermoanaerobaculia bacterium]
MRGRFGIVAALAALLGSPVVGQEPGTKAFTATAEMTTSQGTRTMPMTIIVARPLTVEEAQPLRKTLAEGGQQALLSAIRGGNRGRLNLGNLEYPLELVVTEPLSGGGTRYLVVTTRSLRVEEVNDSAPSLDYPFAVAVFEVPDFGSGEGKLYPRVALSINEDGAVHVEHYDETPGRLKDIRRR